MEECSKVGGKKGGGATRPATADDAKTGGKSFASQGWARTMRMDARGENSTHNFAWFAPSTRKKHPSLADRIGAVEPGRRTFADTTINVGRSLDAHDYNRQMRQQRQAAERRRRAAIGRKRADVVSVNLSADAARNLRLMEERSLEVERMCEGKLGDHHLCQAPPCVTDFWFSPRYRRRN